MLKYICDVCGKEFKWLSPRFQVRKGPQPRYFDRPAVAQICTVFTSTDKNIVHLCANCIRESVDGGEVDCP